MNQGKKIPRRIDPLTLSNDYLYSAGAKNPADSQVVNLQLNERNSGARAYHISLLQFTEHISQLASY